MHGLILAAGAGSRLAALGPSKPLVELGGRSLLHWAMASAQSAGVEKFTVTLGHHAADVAVAARRISKTLGVDIETVDNPRWREANGYSITAAAKHLPSRFYLAMCDHVFEPRLISGLMSTVHKYHEDAALLAVDRRLDNPFVDLEDVTRVTLRGENITHIGKGLESFNAYDCGAFIAGHSLIQAIEKSAKAGDASLSGGMRHLASQGLAFGHDVKNHFWADVDDPNAHKKTAQAIAQADWI